MIGVIVFYPSWTIVSLSQYAPASVAAEFPFACRDDITHVLTIMTCTALTPCVHKTQI